MHEVVGHWHRIEYEILNLFKDGGLRKEISGMFKVLSGHAMTGLPRVMIFLRECSRHR